MDGRRVPLLLAFLAFVGSVIAVFWPWLQTRFRGRKFEGIIRRELEEIGPHPRQLVEGKPWWEHATKRFVHEDVFARERISENRDFLLSLDPAVIYRVSQLWTALGKRDGTQWVYFLGELATDPKVGSDELPPLLRTSERLVSVALGDEGGALWHRGISGRIRRSFGVRRSAFRLTVDALRCRLRGTGPPWLPRVHRPRDRRTPRRRRRRRG
jgi:hypothetical protein